ncbi:50S ribosomal protein L1 [Ureaplasma ceti]|uniref:Large ribosomal subunit protein uL1 n=1 Tax=Ureaplasma ceti TaxID=3119530 RepID=A0ABP9U6E0_9BACT
MAKLTKKMTTSSQLVDKNKHYDLAEAVEIAQKASISSFDGSIDVAIKLNLDTTKVEQQLRGSISLPNGNGKKVRILAIDDSITAEQAKEAGADIFGGSDIIQDVEKMIGQIDLIITTPKMMPQLARYGKVLGPRGLMPNPKTGTVTTDMIKTISEFKKGRTEYRTDTYGNIHMCVGKVSTPANLIVENIEALLQLIKSRRPSTVKGAYIQNISVSPTMGAGVKVIISNN